MEVLLLPGIVALLVYIAYLHQVIAETTSERDRWRDKAFKTMQDYMDSTQQVIHSDEYVQRLRDNDVWLRQHEKEQRAEMLKAAYGKN